ncbi:MAG: anthranilate synthase component I [Caulobacteraceae bacterium]
MKLEPSVEAFASAFTDGRPQLVWARLTDDLETPVSAYLKIAGGDPYAFLFESVEGGERRGRYSVIALRPDLVWRCRGEIAEISEGEAISGGRFTRQGAGALQSLRALVAGNRLQLPRELPPMAAGLFGVLGYDMARLLERLPDPNPDPLGLPDGILIRPSVVAILDSVGQEIILTTVARPTAGWGPDELRADAGSRLARLAEDLSKRLPLRRAAILAPAAPLASPVSREAYGAIVDRAKEYILAGDVFQVVPSHRFSAAFPLAPFALYRSLRRTNPSPYLFYLPFPEFHLVGSSPEILVRLRDETITIRPIAGTRPRGATAQRDRELETELLADPKERAEHLMLLDLGRNDVGRAVLARASGANAPLPFTGRPRVRVTESFTVERYSHVMHIVSNVEGDAPKGVDPVDVLLAALPAGTLSGAPKVRAMEIIDELEDVKRGLVYAGAVGYFGADGSLDTCIVLRTGLIKDGELYAQAGGGIVADSDPDAEYEETLHKAGALRRAAEEAWRFA